MKKQVFRVLALLFSLLFLFGTLASCGGAGENVSLGKASGKFNDVYRAEIPSPGGGYTEFERISLPADTKTLYGEYGFLRYKDAAKDNFCVYSVSEARTVFTIPVSSVYSAEDITLYDGYFTVWRTVDGKMHTQVYGEDGTLLADVEDKFSISGYADGFEMDGKLYYVADGKTEKVYTIPPFLSLDDGEYVFAEDYLIRIGDDRIVYYNEAFEVVAFYEMPAVGCIETQYEVLQSGKIFFAGMSVVDPLEKDYDFLMPIALLGSYKVKMRYELFDPAKNKTTSLSLGVLITDIETDLEDYEYLTDEVESIVSYQKVVDGVLDDTREYYVTMNADGEFGRSLDGFVKGQRGLITPLGESGYYSVETDTGYAILGTDGTLLKEVPAIGVPKAYGYFYDGKIYDKDFKMVKDLDDQNYDLHGLSDSLPVTLYSKTVNGTAKYYCYNALGEAELTPPAGYTIMNVWAGDGRYFSVTMRDSKYNYINRYYSLDGKALLTTKGDVEFLAATDTSALVYYCTVQGNWEYGRLSR